MAALVDAAMEQGALGLSTSLIYPPGSYAKTPELVALARAAARRGGIYATHLRDEGALQMDALDEAFAIAREAAIPVEIWHLKVAGRRNWDEATVVPTTGARRGSTSPRHVSVHASGNGLDNTCPVGHTRRAEMIERFHERSCGGSSRRSARARAANGTIQGGAEDSSSFR